MNCTAATQFNEAVQVALEKREACLFTALFARLENLSLTRVAGGKPIHDFITRSKAPVADIILIERTDGNTGRLRRIRHGGHLPPGQRRRHQQTQ